MIDLDHLEELIREGQFSAVAKAISELMPRKVARADAARIANLANRVDQSRIALKILHPLIKNLDNTAAPPSESELIEYAEGLRRMGLLNEAREVFSRIDINQRPSVLLNISFCYFNEWRYQEAIPHLRRMIQLIDPNEYLNTVAKVNLVAALVHIGQHEEALSLLDELQKTTRRREQRLLLGNCLELRAQVYIGCRNWDKADEVLAEAAQIFSHDANKYGFYVQKDQAVANCMRAGKVLPELVSIRARAAERSDWEAQRDCDLYIAILSCDKQQLDRLFFGTPQDAFRRRIMDLAGNQFSFAEEYIWTAGQESVKRTLDLRTARTDDGQSALDTAGRIHQLLLLLASDFYRPFSIGTIFNTLFPNESYGQDGSANRVWQVVSRLRRWFEEQNLDFSIVEHNGLYRLQLNGEAGIRVTQKRPSYERNDIVWHKVRAELPSQFTRQDLERTCAFSKATAKRLLRWAIDTGQVTAEGVGMYTSYRRIA